MVKKIILQEKLAAAKDAPVNRSNRGSSSGPEYAVACVIGCIVTLVVIAIAGFMVG